MSKITKGNWVIKREEDPNWNERYFYLYSERDGDAYPLATIYGDNAVWLTDEEQHANAEAISAVPELIDALIESKKAIESLGDLDLGVTYTDSYPGDPPDGYRNKDALLHQIEKALKKAGIIDKE